MMVLQLKISKTSGVCVQNKMMIGARGCAETQIGQWRGNERAMFVF